MKQKMGSLLAGIVLLTLTACGSAATHDNTETYKDAGIGISVGEDGHYELVGDLEFHRDAGNVSVYITNPSLRAYQVSSIYKGGLWVLDLEEGQQALDDLIAIAENMRKTGDDSEQIEKIEAIIETLSQAGPHTKAST